MTQLLLRALLICGMVSLLGCGSKLPGVKPYKLEIQQGNVITSKMLLKLRPGMTKSQVRYILGTPLIIDSFHPNRWDYFYELRKQDKVINKRRVILNFQENELVNVEGDVIPAEGDKVADEDANVLKTPKSVAPPKRVETSWWDGLKFWKKDEQAVAASTAEEEEGLFSGLRFWEKGKKANQLNGLSEEDVAIIEAAEQGKKAVAAGAVAEEVAEKRTDAVKAAAVAATTAASAAKKSAEIVEADEENYTFPENQPSAVEAVAEEASADVAAAASQQAEETQSVLRQEIDIVPSTENAEAVVETAVVEAPKAIEPAEQTEEEVSVEEPVMDIAKDQADVADAVNAWADAWRSKDVDAYVAHYVPTFKGKMGSRKSWLKQRDSRIAKRKGDISVGVEDIDVVMDGNKATAYFYQKYRSATYRDAVTKRVDFVRNKNTGEWLIWRETTIPKGKRPQVQKITAPENTDAYLDGAIEKIGF